MNSRAAWHTQLPPSEPSSTPDEYREAREVVSSSTGACPGAYTLKRENWLLQADLTSAPTLGCSGVHLHLPCTDAHTQIQEGLTLGHWNPWKRQCGSPSQLLGPQLVY